jgi:subtilisin family serine protease
MAIHDQLALQELALLVKSHNQPQDLVGAAGGHPLAMVQGKATVGFIGALHPSLSASDWMEWAHDQPHVFPGACRHGIASFRVDAHALDLLPDLPMTLVELASRAVPDLNKARYGTRVDSVHAGLNLPQAYHGEGVLIGVLDWGFDCTHPMFYDTTLTQSRIRGIWDQYRQAGPAPSAFGYGTVAETPWEIQLMGSDTSNVYGYSTHGTHVAGIAAGGGAGVGLTGMAPAAELLFASLMVDEAAALDAFAWMQDVAEADNKRLVINNSWGLPQWGTPDGTSLSNVFIDQLSEEGVVFVSSNGNNGDSNFHIEHAFEAATDTARSRVQFYPLSSHPNAWGQNLTLWGEPGESFGVNFALTVGASNVVGTSPWFDTSAGPFLLDTLQTANGDTIVYDVVAEASHPNNGRPFLQMRIHKGNSGLGVVLQFHAESGTVHAWNHTHLSNDVGNWGQDFQAAQPTWLQGNPYYGIQQPACSNSVIAIGAYSSESLNSVGTEVGGTLAYFSSYGPTLDGRLKPNVSAPGVSVESSLSSFRDGTYTVTSTAEFDGMTYDFAKLSGTSMSSPATAGVVALMLEANPTLTAGDVRDLLEQTAREDNDTGALPSEGDWVWGHGKVTASQAVFAAANMASLVQEFGSSGGQTSLRCAPNPVEQFFWVTGERPQHVKWTLLDLHGHTCRKGNGSTPFVVDMDALTSGVYFFRALGEDEELEVTRIVKLGQ